MERGADWLSVSPAARKSIGKFFATAGQDHRIGLDRGSSVRTSAESRVGAQCTIIFLDGHLRRMRPADAQDASTLQFWYLGGIYFRSGQGRALQVSYSLSSTRARRRQSRSVRNFS